MTVVVFEDDRWSDFAPLTRLRHVSQLRWGTKTLLESVRSTIGAPEVLLWGRPELREVTRAATELPYNTRAGSDTLLLNARIKPGTAMRPLLERTGSFVAMSGPMIVAARTNASSLEPGVLTKRQLQKLSKGVDVLEFPESSVFHGCWDIVESNGLAVAEQAGHFEDQLELPEGTGLRGPASNLRIQGSAEVEEHVTFDSRLGPVVVDEEASIESFSRVSGPCYIGPGARLHSALVRGGTSVFEGCKVGGEVENSIIMPHANKAHLGYVGDSIVGEWVNLGAGSVFSNLKNTYGNVRTELEGRRVDTGMVKFGPVVGDMAKVTIGALIFAGRSVGIASQVTGLAQRNVPSFTYFDGGSGRMTELILDSVIETQKRMMERRGKTLSKDGESLIRLAFTSTRDERKKARVRKGKIA